MHGHMASSERGWHACHHMGWARPLRAPAVAAAQLAGRGIDASQIYMGKVVVCHVSRMKAGGRSVREYKGNDGMRVMRGRGKRGGVRAGAAALMQGTFVYNINKSQS